MGIGTSLKRVLVVRKSGSGEGFEACLVYNSGYREIFEVDDVLFTLSNSKLEDMLEAVQAHCFEDEDEDCLGLVELSDE